MLVLPHLVVRPQRIVMSDARERLVWCGSRKQQVCPTAFLQQVEPKCSLVNRRANRDQAMVAQNQGFVPF